MNEIPNKENVTVGRHQHDALASGDAEHRCHGASGMSADGRRRALTAMAHALAEIGYTRNHSEDEITGPDAMHATARTMRSLLESGDESLLWEFLSEPGGRGTDRAMFGLVIDQMITPSPARARLVGETIPILCRWHGESLIRDALDLLPDCRQTWTDDDRCKAEN